MPLRKTKAALPPDAANTLKTLRETRSPDFHAYLLALRERKWPYRAIGDVFGVTRAAVRSWLLSAAEDPFNYARAESLLPSTPHLPATSRGSSTREKRLIPDVPLPDQARIQSLTAKSSSVRRHTPPNASSRVAAKELEALLHLYAVERHVPIATLARYAGVSRRSISQRIQKEANRLAPSAPALEEPEK